MRVKLPMAALLAMLPMFSGCSIRERPVQMVRETVIVRQTFIVYETLDLAPATTYTPQPTATPRRTYTPRPTLTPAPTATSRAPDPAAVAPNQVVRFEVDSAQMLGCGMIRVFDITLMPVDQFLRETDIFLAELDVNDDTVTIGAISLEVALQRGASLSMYVTSGMVVAGDEQAEIERHLSDSFGSLRGGERATGVIYFELDHTLPAEVRHVHFWAPAPGRFDPAGDDDYFEFYCER